MLVCAIHIKNQRYTCITQSISPPPSLLTLYFLVHSCSSRSLLPPNALSFSMGSEFLQIDGLSDWDGSHTMVRLGTQ